MELIKDAKKGAKKIVKGIDYCYCAGKKGCQTVWQKAGEYDKKIKRKK